jgi:glycosyltransferase involved in cell wall biosynthesis
MSQPIRVLELRSVWGTGGGPEKTILAGARRHTPGIQVTVCYIRDARDAIFSIDARANAAGVDYVELGERHSLDWSVWSALRQLVRSRDIDLVHAHEYKSDLLTYLLAKAEGIVPLATAHGWTGHSARERQFYYPADKWILARYPKVIAVSGEIKRELVSRGADPRRVEVVLNGIAPDVFRRDPGVRDVERRRLGLGVDEIAIGAVGRLEPQKRFDLLIEAFASLRTTYPAVRLLIAGDGSQRQKLEQQIEQRDLGPFCRLVGHVSNVIAFHCALDAFVQASDYEGTPNAVLEAMAMGTPLVATAAGGTAELVTDGVHGLVVPPSDLDQLRHAIERLLADRPGAAVRAANARSRVESELSFDRRMERVEALYEALVGERQAAGRTRAS